MNDTKCFIIKDLLPLHIDGILSDETKEIVEEHLINCNSCRSYFDDIKNEDLNINIDTKGLEKDGEKIINKIKKSQDRIKYAFIIFAMFISVSNGWLSKGIMSTIPMIIVVPLVLRLLFNESKIILITAICSNILISVASDNSEWGIISTSLITLAVASGLILGRLVLSLWEEK